MRFHRIILAGFVLIALTTVTAAELTTDDQVNLDLSETEMTVGDTITATVSLMNHSESNYTYQYEIGAGRVVNATEPSTSLTISDQSAQVIMVYPMRNGERVGPHDTVDIDVEEAEEPELDIAMDPSEVTPGAVFNATVTYGGEVRDDFQYRWRESGITGGEEWSSTLNTTGPRVTIRTRDDGRAPDEADLSVSVRNADNDYLGRVETTIEWDPLNPDVDGIEADYSDGEVDLAITEQKLEDLPEVRIGSAIDGWSQVEFWGHDIVGGTEVLIEQIDAEELDVPDDLVLYSAADVSGENIDGLVMYHRANVDHDWLQEHDLMITEDQAHVSFYKVEDGSWTRLPSDVGYSDLENYVSIEPDYRADDSREPYRLDGPGRFVIAGNTSGIDFGRFAIGPEDQCERLSEDEPIPLGWEEIEVTCDVHDRAQHVEENLQRFEEDFNSTERREHREELEPYEPPEEFRDRLEDIRESVDEYELLKAQENIEMLEEDLREDREHWYDIQRLRNRYEQRMNPLEEINRTLQELPEGFKEDYTGDERIRNLTDDLEMALDEGNATRAEQLYDALREARHEEERDLQEMIGVAHEIRNVRQRNLNETQNAMVDEAEELLADGNVTAARERVERVEDQLERDRPNIIEIIRQVIAEILGGGNADAQIQQEPAGQTQQEDRQMPQGENGSMPPGAGPQSRSSEGQAQP